jgi:hypothetical protein
MNDTSLYNQQCLNQLITLFAEQPTNEYLSELVKLKMKYTHEYDIEIARLDKEWQIQRDNYQFHLYRQNNQFRYYLALIDRGYENPY